MESVHQVRYHLVNESFAQILKVIYHPLYGMTNYVLIWRGWHDSQSPTPYKETLVPHLVATLIYLSQNYSYYIRGDRSPLKSKNHIQITTHHEMHIMNLMELLNSQVSSGKHISRPIDILSNTRIPGLAIIPSVQTFVSVNTTVIMMAVDEITLYQLTSLMIPHTFQCTISAWPPYEFVAYSLQALFIKDCA